MALLPILAANLSAQGPINPYWIARTVQAVARSPVGPPSFRESKTTLSRQHHNKTLGIEESSPQAPPVESGG
jgi:hypothetical protein